MARKDITDLMVVQAYAAWREQRDAGDPDRLYPYQALARATGEHENVAWRACERADAHGLLEWGVSLKGAWLTEKGKALLKHGGKSAVATALENLTADPH
jgi:hypothetical protein